MDRLIASCRVAVEHAIGGLRRYRAAADVNRSRHDFDDRLSLVAAGLRNFRLQTH